PEGRIARWEQFDVGQEGEALARFDELVTGRDPEVTRRHVRPNAATANGTRLAAALNARDADAVAATLAEGVETIDHTTGAVLDRQGMLYTYTSGFKARDATYRNEALATLGDSLALGRMLLSSSGYTGARLDVGAYDLEHIGVLEVN